jgi:hypothetical protein
MRYPLGAPMGVANYCTNGTLFRLACNRVIASSQRRRRCRATAAGNGTLLAFESIGL